MSQFMPKGKWIFLYELSSFPVNGNSMTNEYEQSKFLVQMLEFELLPNYNPSVWT